jgi:signal transduction histidine kinase
MRITEPTRKLLFQHEVLRAKLELKNHLLESVVKDIYEQTGQVLSLVRVRLATVEGQLNEHLKGEIAETGILVSDAISRLRRISKHLFPEQEILTDSGFLKTLYDELQLNFGCSAEILHVSGTTSTLDEEPGVILLAIILSIISCIKTLSIENTLNVKIEYREKDILISIVYQGRPIDLGIAGSLNENDLSANLNIRQRLQLIRGSITSETDDDNTIAYKIKVPL